MGTIYDVTITGIAGSAPSDGFIDPKTSYSYMDTDSEAPTDLAKAKAKMRANRRYKNVIMEVHRMTNAYVVSVETTGADANTAASEIVIRFDIEHGDDALRTLVTEEEDAPNAGDLLTGEAALKRCVARALMREDENRNVEYYDPTSVVGRNVDGEAADGRPRGPVINVETIGALVDNIGDAEDAVEVSSVS